MCRLAGYSWLWRGPTGPVLSADGLVLASGGPRRSLSGGRRKSGTEGGGGREAAVKHPPAGLSRENSRLWGYRMAPAPQKTREPVEAIHTALWEGRPRARGHPCQGRAALVSYGKPSLTSSFSNFKILSRCPQRSRSLQNLLVYLQHHSQTSRTST